MVTYLRPDDNILIMYILYKLTREWNIITHFFLWEVTYNIYLMTKYLTYNKTID